MDRWLDPRNFDPSVRDQVVRTYQMMFLEMSGNETYLIEAYRGVLERLGRPRP